MARFRGIVIFLVGLVLVMLGLSMWRSPEISWSGFLGQWVLVGKEMARLVADPFAILGIVVVVVGSWIAMKGLRGLVKG